MIDSQSPGSGDGASYLWTDTTAAAETTYWYWLEMINVYGDRERFGPITVSDVAPTAVALSTLTATPPADRGVGGVLLTGGLLLLGFVWRRR